jgi:hypothetical protein
MLQSPKRVEFCACQRPSVLLELTVENVDPKLATLVRDPMVWQWQDDRGAWHTYPPQQCRALEAAFLAGDQELALPTTTINLNTRHEIREDTGTAR